MFVGLEKLSLVDYDNKVSCILFKQGCNFRCPFCHNSSLVTRLKENTEIPFEEILAYLRKRKGVLDAVVISGGEPTLDLGLKDEIKKIKEIGYLIKLDTNGTHPEVIKDLLENNLLDYIAMDIKNSFEKYPSTIGVDNYEKEKILQSIDLIINSKIDYEFRTTLIEEFHSLEDMNKIGEIIKGAKKFYLQKFIDHETNIEQGLRSVTKENALIYKSVLSKYVESVELRGY
ncbi:MAG: anaerobic ribonucleoside-triphosphate reductase activating protein [Bacilli bacterium]|jgi:anaerobic ribonucleoside-triphosphate reductase activating protein